VAGALRLPRRKYAAAMITTPATRMMMIFLGFDEFILHLCPEPLRSRRMKKCGNHHIF
jgi:hypothetical protein